jgi:hypothetical protein
MVERQPQPRLRESHDTLVGERTTRFRRASAGSFGTLPPEEIDGKTSHDKLGQAMDSVPTSPSDDDADWDLEKDAEAPVPQSRKDEKSKDPQSCRV